MSSQEKALGWITQKLNEHKIAYQIVGGLAAKVYGSERELADIDIYISYRQAGNFLDDISEYI